MAYFNFLGNLVINTVWILGVLLIVFFILAVCSGRAGAAFIAGVVAKSGSILFSGWIFFWRLAWALNTAKQAMGQPSTNTAKINQPAKRLGSPLFCY